MITPVHVDGMTDPGIAMLALNDPSRRNALSTSMFDALDNALDSIRKNAEARVLLLTANGPAFCAGFDLPSAVENPALLGQFILRLSQLIRALRRLSAIVVAQVQGPAIAGGCAMLSACDFIWAAPDATMGYPVHGIGLSPAVTIPTLSQAILPGAARALLMSGRLMSAAEARQLGLVSHLASSGESLAEECLAAWPPVCRRAVASIAASRC